MEQLARVKDLPVPEFGNLQAWEARAHMAARAANGDPNGNDPSRSSQGYGGTPMPFLGDTKVTFMRFSTLFSSRMVFIYSLSQKHVYLFFVLSQIMILQLGTKLTVF